MRKRARKILDRIAGPVMNFAAPGAIILGYHRVSDADWDPLHLAVSTENFRSHLDVLSANYHPIELSDLVARKKSGTNLKGHVSITFDDGCEDFLRNALPELVDRNIPVTIFVTTGFAGRPFWWDEVSCLLTDSNLVVDCMELDFGATEGKRIFGGLNSNDAIADAVREICNQLLHVDASMRSDIITQILGHTAGSLKNTLVPRAMTRQHLAELSAIPLVEIAAHSMTHPLLSRLDEADQMSEIRGSKSFLEAIGNEVKGFSYPNGSYSPLTRDNVQKCRFEYACTSRQAAVRRRSDCYQLPRVWAPNIGGQAFGRWISRWSGSRNWRR